MTTVCFSFKEQQQEVEAVAESIKGVKDFTYNWRRWGNWERHMPIVAMELPSADYELDIIGFHAATFSERSGYVNSYYQAVLPVWQGGGIGGKMVDFLLEQACLKGMKRLKCKTPQNSPGYRFWTGFGLKPFAFNSHEFLFDIEIDGIMNCDQLIQYMNATGCALNIPDKEMEKYKLQKGVVLL